MSDEKKPLRASPAVEGVFDMVEREARKVMDRVGLTDDDFDSMPPGISFENFSARLDEIMAKKQKKGDGPTG